jgi:PKD repeat protein
MLDFQICNEGAAPLLFSLSEMTATAKLEGSLDFSPAGSPPAGPAPEADLSTYQPFEGEFVAPAAPQNPEAVLWDQPITTTNLGAYANQDFETPIDAFDIFIADDFSNGEWWSIDTIYVPGNTWNLGGDLECAGLLHWQIYADDGGMPAGDPWGGGDAPVWNYYGPTSDPNVVFSAGVGGFQSDVTLNLDAPLNLPPGDWWLVFYPSLSFSNCFQYGRHVSGTSNGAPAHVINPGGGFGFPTTWTPVTDPSTWGLTAYQDMAFRLEGDTLADVPWLSEDPTTGSLEAGQCITIDLYFDATNLMPGGYYADLTIDSNDPDTPMATLPVTLTVWAPAAIMDVTYDIVDLTVTFDATAVGEEPVNFNWDFGDTGTSTDEDPVHTFGDYGCYTVTLDVDNVCGFDTWTEEICFCEPIEGAGFDWSPVMPIVDETAYFSATMPLTGTGPFTFTWDFGDNVKDVGMYVTHVFTMPDTYSVTLTVENACSEAPVVVPITVKSAMMYYYLPIVIKND